MPNPKRSKTGSAHPRTLLLETASGIEKQFLAGKRDRGADLESAVRIFLEFLRGYEFFGDLQQPCVTVFGSARFKASHPYYRMARALGRRLAEEGFAVMTGGGPGIMEAANRGAREAGGTSLGCNITLPLEQKGKPLPRPVHRDEPFLRPQGHAGEILVRVRGDAGRLWHPRRSFSKPSRSSSARRSTASRSWPWAPGSGRPCAGLPTSR
jgi:hypothetical protein